MHDMVMDEGCVLSSQSCKAVPSAVQLVAPALALLLLNAQCLCPSTRRPSLQPGTIGVAHVTGSKRDV